MNEAELTDEQKECIYFDPEKDLIIQGEAGSGKSTVLIKRALELYDKSVECGENVKIIIFTFTNSLVNYTSELIQRERADAAGKIVVKTLDSVICDVYKALTGRSTYDIYNDYIRVLNNVVGQLQYSKYPGKIRFFKYEKRDFLLDEIKWMKQHMFTSVAAYKKSVRTGRGLVRLTREERPIIYDVYKQYYSYLRIKKYYTIDMICDEIIRLHDIPEDLMYDYVLVDEAQDLPLSKMMIASFLAKNSITIAADFSQRIYKNGFTWKEIGVKIHSNSSKKLRGTHRNSKQIASLANSLLARNTELSTYDAECMPMQMPDKDGPKPILKYETTYRQEELDVVSLIKLLLTKNQEARVAVLCYGISEMKQVAKWLRNSDISYQKINRNFDYELLLPGVKLVTYHSAKGLEFNNVIMPLLDKDLFPHIENIDMKDKNAIEDSLNIGRSLMYVGMTRATDSVYMFACRGEDGMPSPVLKDFDRCYMRVIGNEEELFSEV